MKATKQSTQSREEGVTRGLFWGTIVLDVITTLVFGYFFIFFLQLDKTPTIYLAVAIFLFAIIASVVSIVLIIRRQQELGVKLTFYMLQIAGLTIVSIFQGRTPNASFSILVISAIAITWLLPSQWRRWYSVVASGAFILMWAIEWFNPPWRVAIEAATIGPAAVIVFALIF